MNYNWKKVFDDYDYEDIRGERPVSSKGVKNYLKNGENYLKRGLLANSLPVSRS